MKPSGARRTGAHAREPTRLLRHQPTTCVRGWPRSDPSAILSGVSDPITDDPEVFSELNVLGEALEVCGTDPVTGFFRDGCCSTGPEDQGSHTICAVMTAEFLAHQRSIGNDLSSPMPHYRFPGLVPGDRWCVTARNWLRAHYDGAAAPVVLASTNWRVLDIVPLEVLRRYAVDVPPDASSFDELA
jgi:uncharacterized protein